MMIENDVMTVRPYQVMCAVCALGAGEVSSFFATVRDTPDLPVTLRCNVGEVFGYQDPGTEGDTPEGAEYNLRRDLEILHKLNLFPGATLPARVIVNRLLERIDDTAGICGYDAATAEGWQGCAKASSGDYRRGRALGIEAICPPRTAQELQAEKAQSLDAMHREAAVRVRPHILLCALCQYGSGVRPPFPEDNLPEFLQRIREQPDTPVMLVPSADWMMCAPCPSRAPACNGCVNNQGVGGLSNQLRDLRVLQKLGLTFGATLPARDLYRLIFTRISGTLEICRLEHAAPSVWHTGCGAAETDSADYAKGSAQFMAELG